jgi:tetratricopeptide (TPR) repeat protein
MDLDKTLEILQAAQGDPALLSLTSVDLLLNGRSENDRKKLRAALEIASVPHWFDEEILGILLDEPLSPEAQSLASQLRSLPVVEPFPARGPGAANVHETARLALRRRMKKESADRLVALSKRAQFYFGGKAPHLRIEALYHQFTVDPEAAERACGSLFYEWRNAGRYEELLALGVTLDELQGSGLLAAWVRGSVLYYLANIRYNYQPRNVTADQARDALAETQRRDTPWRIANAHDLMGNVLSDQGDLFGALKNYRDSLALREKLANQDPANAGWQRDLSVSYEKVGDVLSDQGELSDALKSYRDSLAIREKLVNRDPANAGWQRDLSISYNKVGTVLSAQGELSGALKSYRDSLAIAEKLAKQDPTNAGWQRDLSVSYDKVGTVLSAQGELSDALKNYRDSLALREKLAKQDPANADSQRNLSISYDKVGTVLSAQGELSDALKNYRDSLAIAEKLAKQDPTNAGWQHDLAWIYWRTGSTWAKVEPESRKEARGMLEKGRDVLRESKERTGLTANAQGWLDGIEAELRKM